MSDFGGPENPGAIGAKPAPRSGVAEEAGLPPLVLSGQFDWSLGEGQAATLSFFETPSEVVLEIMIVPSRWRAQGVGTQMVERLLLLADALGKPVRTIARPLGQARPEIVERLVCYYRRFGFEAVKPGIRSVEMLRPAGGAPTSGVPG